LEGAGARIERHRGHGGAAALLLLSLALASWADQRWIDGFYRGFLRLARPTGTTLAGGDLAHADRTTCDVGGVRGRAAGKALRRDGARPGDASTFPAAWAAPHWDWQPAAVRPGRSTRGPSRGLEFGRTLRVRASAAIDLSDGLSLDLHRLSLARRVSGRPREAIPLFPGASLEQALHGARIYELLFTARAEVEGAIRVGVIRKAGPGV